MKKLFCLLFVVALCVLAAPNTFAQTIGVSDQKFQELVNEVRQLRIEVQRLSTSAQRMQLLLERTRSQQEQVVRLTQQLSGVRARQAVLKDELAEAEKGKQAGTGNPAAVTALTTELRNLAQLEQRLSDRELQVSSELELERATLNDLKTRLDKLEQEIATPGIEPTKKQD